MTAALAFFSSRLGQAVALVGLLACGGCYVQGRRDQARLDDVANLKTQLAAAKADLAISVKLADAAEVERQAAQQAAAANQDRIDDYEKALAARPDARCGLDADDVRRLRALNPAP